MRVLLLEDEKELGLSVKQGLSAAGFTVDVTARLATAEAALQSVAYDVAIFDRKVPDGDGLTLLKRARELRRAIPILVLSAYGGVHARVEGLDQGADDYLTKPFKIVELVARVRALLRRPAQLSASTLTAGNVAFDVMTRGVVVAGQPVSVARREVMLLEQLMRRPKQVVTRETLEQILFDFDAGDPRNAIEASVYRLRKTLTERGADYQIHTVRGVGYCLAP